MWKLPTVDLLLKKQPERIINPQELRRKARLIEETLASWGVASYVREVNTGPTIDQFALELDTGTRIAKVVELQDQLASALSNPNIRIEAPIPGQNRIGIEVARKSENSVRLIELLNSKEFHTAKGTLKFPIGFSVPGMPVATDLTKMPHLLISGSPGSGKSNFVHTIILSLLSKYSPEQLQFIFIDTKIVELQRYNSIPHFICNALSFLVQINKI